MPIAIFIFYLLLFSATILIIPFFKNSGIKKNHLVGLFIIKVIAGIGYAKFYLLPKNYPTADTWLFYRLSLEETRWLRRDPLSFIKDLFISGYYTKGNIFSSENSYWNDLRSNIMIKLIAVFNLLTNNSYYADILFFNFLFLFGLVALFKVLLGLYPRQYWLIVVGLFLWPSTLFWCSGIHKDGLLLSAIGLLIYACLHLLNKGFSIKQFLICIVSSLCIFLLRNYLLLALIPALVAWILATWHPNKKLLIFTLVYACILLVFLLLPHFFPSVNPATYLTNKREEFLLLPAGSAVSTTSLQSTPSALLAFFPQAVDMAFLRPHLWEIKNISYIPAILENVLFIGLLILFVVSLQKKMTIPPVVLCMFTFTISVLLICGYTVPISGAIIRYKSVVLPLLITPLICLINQARWRKKISV